MRVAAAALSRHAAQVRGRFVLLEAGVWQTNLFFAAATSGGKGSAVSPE